MINWVEIPAANIDRAIRFYSKILAKPIRRTRFMGMHYAFIPGDRDNRGTPDSTIGAIAQSIEHRPSMGGVTIYLDGGNDLNIILRRVEGAGGVVMTPKTSLGASGYFAVFCDTEGNRVGLHSPH